MSKAAGLYLSSAVVWAINFIQARQEATSTADLIAMFSVVATILTALATIIAMLNKTREGSVKELTALLKLERDRIKKLERANAALVKELQAFRDQASKLIFESRARRDKSARKPKKKSLLKK